MLNRVLAVTFVVCLLIAAYARGQETPPDDCLSPKRLGALMHACAETCAEAVKPCPEIPACPEIPQQFVLCRQSWDGKVVRCKRFAWKAVPAVVDSIGQ